MTIDNTTLMRQLNQTVMALTRNQYAGGMIQNGVANPNRGQGRVLRVLQAHPASSQKQLAELLDIKNQSLSELLTKMVKAGHITKTQSPTDKRVFTIELTAAGQVAAKELQRQHQTYDYPEFAILTADEQANLSDYLARLSTAAKQANHAKETATNNQTNNVELTPQRLAQLKAQRIADAGL
jgi:DNA-binding MarR family transcriptional regulator